ncbi:recombination protein RecR [Candidatus Azambacteria bacterium]|nr:recombination protein RecR [Candidatus Azambacteria bacterium]
MYPKPIKNFIDNFSKLPGIGPRQAARLAFWILNDKKNIKEDLKKALEGLAGKVKSCDFCHFAIENGDNNKCAFCDNPVRDHKTICVVEKETDLATIEKAGVYKGLYHVLGGLFSALDTAIPKNLKIPELASRVESKMGADNEIEEIILALSPTHEGDLTARHLERLLKPFKVKITRLGRGLPYGSDVEFADAKTLSGALESRKELK